MFFAEFPRLWSSISARPCSPFDDPAFGSGGELDSSLVQCSREAKFRAFAGALQAVSPLYVSSICKEQCSYCNYRAGSSDPELKRVRLGEDELAREVEFLVAEKGLRAVELVYASDPLIGVEQIRRHVAIAKAILERHGGGRVGLSAEPLDVDGYRSLVQAGLSFSVVWQETYDPARYAELHPGRQTKTDFGWRLDSFERMLEAGLEDVGIGVLSGLADWRRDWSMLILHQEWLRRECGRGPSILGIPRLKPAPGVQAADFTHVPSDRQFVALVALHNSRFPDVRPFVSTREEFDLCLELAAGGGCLFTFNCSTVPGGYTLPNRGAQFAAGDFDAARFAGRVEAAGFGIDWDWKPNPCYT